MPMTTPDGSEWKLVDYPSIMPGYQVSLYGEVLSPQGRKVKVQLRRGIPTVALRLAGRTSSTTMSLGQLVLATFDHYAPHLVPEYLDGNPANCHLTNLRWREPTEREARAKKAVATARAARQGGAKKRSAAPKQSVVAPEAPQVAPRVEMFRTYRAAGLEVLVTPAGEIPAKGLPQGRLTPTKVAALAAILQDVVAMNTLMGAGK